MKKRFSLINIIVIVLVVSLIAGGAYFLGTQKISKPENNNSKIISPIPTLVLTAVPSVGPTVDETVTLKVIIKQALVAKHGSNANQLNITVSKIERNYAQGGASVINQGGGMWFATKVNSAWKLVWDGNGVILCSDLMAYPDFPTNMIPECFNDKTNKIVVR